MRSDSIEVMGMPKDDVESQLIRDILNETREDLREIKTNHLAHIERDMAQIKTDVAVLTQRLQPVELFVSDFNRRMLFIVMGAVAAVLGLPMMM
tara:strand:+ start:28 stop:309 length:282 start_codon:yes stop_codon:yes gene_type:complete